MEVLLGLAISTVVMAAALAALGQTLTVHEWITAQHAEQEIAGRLVELVALDFRQVTSAAGAGSAMPLRYREQPDGSLQLELLSFSSLAPGATLPAGLYRVVYHYDAQSGVLQRSEEPLTDHNEPESGAWSVTLADSIEQFSCRFFDRSQWLDHWPPANRTSSVPATVRIDVRLADRRGAEEASRAIWIPVE